jgi:hypothetical protein
MIDILNNGENIMIFLSRLDIYKLNIHKLICNVSNINIIPIKITCSTLNPIYHPRSNLIINTMVLFKHNFYLSILNKINYKQDYDQKDFIRIIKKILYPDNGYFDTNNKFVI